MYNQGSVSDLLRIAYTVARKLKVDKFASWAKQELDGYQSIDNSVIPEYRIVRGQLRGLNPYRGWIPAVIPDDNFAHTVESTVLFESVPEIEHLLSNNNGTLQKPLPHAASATLSKFFHMETQFTLIIERSALEGILQDIRQRVLEWALQLEEEGILGDGVQFSDEEKRTAQGSTVQNWTTNNFIAPGGIQQLQQGTSHSTQSMEVQQQIDTQQLQTLTEQIRSHLGQTELGEEEQSEVLRELETLTLQAQSDSPEPGIISKSLTFIRGALEKATGTVVATGLLTLIDNFLHLMKHM